MQDKTPEFLLVFDQFIRKITMWSILKTGAFPLKPARLGLFDGALVVVSDHDRHSLRLSFPFDREMGGLFDALGLDVHDLPGEGPACDAVVASNGGMAHVYLSRRNGAW